VASESASAVAAPFLLTALPDTVVVADANGHISHVDPAVRVLLGHEPSTVAPDGRRAPCASPGLAGVGVRRPHRLGLR
jgi:hypothetical protein